MMRTHLITMLLGLASACYGMNAARSEPLRIALIVSNGQYGSMPPLERCGASATTVRDALRGKGFEIMERKDLRRGEFDAAIGALARRTASSPATFAALYYCGYAVEFNGRSFVLPTSASLTGDYDVLTQGIISKSLIDSLARAKESTGFVLLDVFRAPNAAATGLGRLGDQIQPSNFAVIGVGNEEAAGGPTAASLALRDQVVDGEVSLEAFTNGMRRQLSGAAAVTAHLVPAIGHPSFLTSGRRDASPPPAAAAVPVHPAPAPEPSPSASPISQPRQTMVDEDRMSEQDRRQVQATLATLGYYSGRIDAAFGPETRAAIRRYQFEIKAEQTGRLTAEQATKLVNSVR